MAKANIELDGLNINLEGSPKEIGEILEFLREREEKKKEREDRFIKWRKRREELNERRNGKAHQFAPSNLTSLINNYLEKGFFDTPRIAKEVLMKLRGEGLDIPPTTLHPILARFVVKGILKRKKNQDEVWGYEKV